MGSTPDRAEFHRRQAGDRDEDNVAALGQGQAGHCRVHDLAAGHQRESLVQADHDAGTADGPAGRVRGGTMASNRAPGGAQGIS
ncbi:MAG: hypothetical protein ACYCO9_10275 [Streptosporangiaceae bacterium]